MSILIKTMTKLPEHCYECPCHDGESGYCQADEKSRCSDYRPFWCPLEMIDYTCEDTVNRQTRTDEEIKLGDEVVSNYGAKGVVVGTDTYKGEVLLSLLMRNYNVPQLVNASAYKTTGKHFPQIKEIKNEASNI